MPTSNDNVYITNGAVLSRSAKIQASTVAFEGTCSLETSGSVEFGIVGYQNNAQTITINITSPGYVCVVKRCPQRTVAKSVFVVSVRASLSIQTFYIQNNCNLIFFGGSHSLGIVHLLPPAVLNVQTLQLPVTLAATSMADRAGVLSVVGVTPLAINLQNSLNLAQMRVDGSNVALVAADFQITNLNVACPLSMITTG